MSDEKENLNEEDYLKRHLSDIDNSINSDMSFNNVEPVMDRSRVSDLQYFNFDIRELPCGNFYPTGTLFMVRPAQVREIQAYSMVDENNFHDIIEKMNDMLQACVRIKYTDGRVGSFLEIKDPDRMFLIFLIRELTFQQGNSLSINTRCNVCSEEVQIELKRENFKFYEVEDKLSKFFNLSTRSYKFKVKNGKEFDVNPPNIGLQKAFTEYIMRENAEKKIPNLSFLKIIPFMLEGRTSITLEGIKAKLKEFEEIDDISFQFLNAAISKMTFGIKELKKICTCGEEIHAEMQFPNGAAGIFLIPDAFDTLIKE